MVGLSHTKPRSVQQFVAIIEVLRFAPLRRSLGFALANRLLDILRSRMVMHVDGCEIGRRGRTTIEMAFEATDACAARAMLVGLGKVVEERTIVDGVSFDLNVAIGFASGRANDIDEEALDQAAAALADAITRRSTVVFAGDLDDLPDDVALMRDLSSALAEDQLELHYQPKLRLRTNDVDSAEGLLRWTHPTRGPVSIATFITAAEETGAIREVTEWTIARAIRDQAILRAQRHQLCLYVNISGVLLPDPAFAARALAMVGDAGGAIGFEITETAVIEDPAGAIANLRAFTDAGIRIAIDDYGSGLSSLAYLKRLPANELKIDRMFVADLVNSHRDPLLVRSSIDLAHALEMEVTAEGVDDPMALALLRIMGCDLAQGYLIARPMPLAELVAFLDDGRHIGKLAAAPSPLSGWPSGAVAER